MLDLAIETSCSRGSIALGNDQVVVQSIDLAAGKRHSATLFPALTRLGLPRLKIRRIIVGVGPGSFSGIRVGIAAAQGIALVQNVPVFGICSAWSVAAQQPQVTRLGVFADAKRREAFCTAFANGRLDRATYLLPMAELEDHAGKFTLAVSAEPLAGVPTRVYPRACDFLGFPENFAGWITEQPLEPIYPAGADRRASVPKLMPGRRCWVEIDGRALRHNVKIIRGLIPRTTRLLAVVKANGYGHGLVPVAREFEGAGVDWLGVANVAEGMSLRHGGVTKPILILSATLLEEMEDAVKHRLTLTLSSVDEARALALAARPTARPADAHFKIDTGMGRLGCLAS